MIFFAVIIFVAAIAFFITKFSMRNFVRISGKDVPSSLFLISDASLMTNEVMEELIDFCLKEQSPVSFERLYKGEQSALAIFGPDSLVSKFPQLGLVELEDYIGEAAAALTKNTCLVWDITPFTAKFSGNFLQDLGLEENDRFCLQMVCLAKKTKQTALFLTNIRCLVASNSPHDRVNLAKKIQTLILSEAKTKGKNPEVSPHQFELYTKRSFIDKGKRVETARVLQLLTNF
jgi:hypothetical protein